MNDTCSMVLGFAEGSAPWPFSMAKAHGSRLIAPEGEAAGP